MKQFYLLAAGLMLAATAVAADETTAYFTWGKNQNAFGGNTENVGYLFAYGADVDIYSSTNNYKSGNATITFSKVAGGVESEATNNGALRWNDGTQMTISVPNGVAITKIVFQAPSASEFKYAVAPTITKGDGSFTVDTSGTLGYMTWTGSTSSVSFVPEADKQVRFQSIAVTYTGTPVVAEPKYEVANIAEFLAKADTKNVYTITGELTYIYKWSSWVFWKDADNNALIAKMSNHTSGIKNGCVVKGLKVLYNAGVQNMPGGMNGVMPAEFTVGDPVEPTVVTVPEIATTPFASYIRFNGVHVNPTMFKNTNIYVDLFSDAECTEENKATLTDKFALFNKDAEDATVVLGYWFEVDKTYDIVAFIGANGSKARQIWPMEIIESTATTAVDAIEADSTEAAEYFNLQGIRVDAERLAPGSIYIVRQGNTAKKIIK